MRDGVPDRAPDHPISPPPEVASHAEAPARTLSSTIVVAAGFVGVAACLLAIGTLAQAIREKEASALDTFATPFLHALASPWLDAAMQAATFLGSNVVIVPAYAAATAGLLRRRRREALFVSTVLIGSLALNGAMKLFFQRPRPMLAWAQVLPDYSFPSGHSMNSLAFFLALAVVMWQVRGHRWGRLAVGIAVVASLAIGVSRIYLGYHYLTDVIGGYLAAVLWLLVVVGAFSGGQRLLHRWRDPIRRRAERVAR